MSKRVYEDLDPETLHKLFAFYRDMENKFRAERQAIAEVMRHRTFLNIYLEDINLKKIDEGDLNG